MKRTLRSDRLYESTSSLVAALIFIIFGSLLLFFRSTLYFDVIYVFVGLIIGWGAIQIVYLLFQKKDSYKQKEQFIKSFLLLLFGGILAFIPAIPFAFLSLIFAFYMFLNGIIKLFSYLILLHSRANGRLYTLLLAIIYLLIAIPLFFEPIKNVDTMLIIVGFYTLFLGLTFLRDFILGIIPKRYKKKIVRRFRVTLPAILEAIIPYSVLREINYYLDKEAYDAPLVHEEKTEDVEPDMEIFVHVAPSSYNRFGHVDVCVDSTVISYGAYDFSTSKFHNMIGEGMVFTVDKEKYIHYCTHFSNKTLFCFGLQLTKKEKENVQKQIDKIMHNVTPYVTMYEQDRAAGKIIDPATYVDYPSKLKGLADASFYKVNSGLFKTFFVLGVNCCMLADYIVGKSGCEILKMIGIITPGTYYEYLNREFYKKNSMVVSRVIYHNLSVTKKKKILQNGSF